ncbi:MAG: hypothetical protein R2795_18225 [Saprospiraceae bacterium]
MRQIWILFIICCIITDCEKRVDSLCNETSSNVYDFEGLKVYRSLEDGLSCAKIKEKPILLLFSCFACVGDTSYERELFVENPNRAIIDKNYVPIILYVDDKTPLENSYRVSVNSDGKVRWISTIGEKNALYQMQIFESTSQPFFVILDGEGNKILDPIGYQSSSSSYRSYLEMGIKSYKQLKGNARKTVKGE